MILSITRCDVPSIDSLGLAFKIHEMSLSDIKVVRGKNYDPNARQNSKHNMKNILFKFPNGALKRASDRFWLSLASRAGIGSSIFRHFSYEEVFGRITTNGSLGNGPVRIVEDIRTEECLGITSISKPIINYNTLLSLIEGNGRYITYNNAILRSWHDMPGGAPFKVNEEVYTPMMLVEVPIDGYGNVNVYSAVRREKNQARLAVCGAAYKTQIAIGKNAEEAIDAIKRTLDSYSNDETIDAITNRLIVATKSILSVEEYGNIKKILIPILSYNAKSKTSENSATSIGKSLNKMVGNISKAYGIASIDNLSSKERASLPTGCRVSEMFNFLSELSSFILTRRENDIKDVMTIYNIIGAMMSKDYDLEKLLPKNKKSTDVHVDYYFSKE